MGADEVTGIAGCDWIRGDGNGDGTMDVSNPVFSLASLFSIGAPQSSCADATDSNDDGSFDISDPVYSLAWLFSPGAPPLPPPFPGCGSDPTADALGCVEYTACP